ncbi:MAG: NAD(P)H-dependent oxidoreductase subunit E [Phycisphaerae bacterium]
MPWIVKDRLQTYAPTRTEPYLTPAMLETIRTTYFPRYPTKRAALLPLFHLVMHEYGFIAPQAIDEAAAFLEVAPAEVQDAATFYEEFRFEPSGKYVVQVCRSLACELLGHEAIVAKIRDTFGLEVGETTEDGLITLQEVECVGCCEQAPAALVNGTIHGYLTPEGFVHKLQALPKDGPSHH